MSAPRRKFLKVATGVLGAAGALRFAPWIVDAEAAQAAAVDAVRDEVADAALAVARRLGASYADVRVNRLRTESVATREQQVQNVARNQSVGFGVRVLVNGTWGFAASPVLTADEARRIAEVAVDIGKANARVQRKRLTLAPVDAVKTTWKSAFKIDPLDVPLDAKVQFLLKLNQAAMETKGVTFVDSSMRWISEQKFLATSEGSRIDQHLVRGGTSIPIPGRPRRARPAKRR
jgi:TldD protein